GHGRRAAGRGPGLGRPGWRRARAGRPRTALRARAARALRRALPRPRPGPAPPGAPVPGRPAGRPGPPGLVRAPPARVHVQPGAAGGTAVLALGPAAGAGGVSAT